MYNAISSAAPSVTGRRPQMIAQGAASVQGSGRKRPGLGQLGVRTQPRLQRFLVPCGFFPHRRPVAHLHAGPGCWPGSGVFVAVTIPGRKRRAKWSILTSHWVQPCCFDKFPVAFIHQASGGARAACLIQTGLAGLTEPESVLFNLYLLAMSHCHRAIYLRTSQMKREICWPSHTSAGYKRSFN